MRRIAMIAALLVLLGCMSACMPEESPNGSQTTPSITTSPEPGQTLPPGNTTVPMPGTTPPAMEIPQISLSSLSTPIVRECFYAEDGTLLLNYIYQNVFLVYPDGAVGEAVTLSLLNAIDYSSGLQDILSQAKENHAASPIGWTAYSYQVLFDTMRIDQTVVSIFGEITSSGADTSSIHVGSSYSLIDGKQLSFGDIQSNGYHYYNLLLLVDAQLRQRQDSDKLFPDYQETLSSQLRSKDCSNWFFTETGLCFFYLPTEIAPNSMGTIIVEIPYSELVGLIRDDFFPAEDYVTDGSIQAQLFDDAEIFRYQQFAELIQSGDSEEILLSTDSAVADIRMEIGTWDASGTVFTPTATVFACDGISADTAIVVQCELPDVLPTLRIRYVSKGESHTYFIAQSGKDNSILLIE